MRLKPLFSTAAGLLVGALIGATVLLTAGADPQESRDPSREAPVTREQLIQDYGVAPEYLEMRTNDSGETYGSLLISLMEGALVPDLVVVIMDDGSDGYVYASELLGPFAANPQEAVKMAEEQAKNGAQPVVIIARDEQGKPIGTYTRDG